MRAEVHSMSKKGETMGQRLKRFREAAGLSQPALAQAARVPVGSLRNWEYGIRQPRLDAAARLARALGITLDELASAEAPPAGQGGPEPKKGKKGKK
jgi:transcriptional regulator with XRE-family HTH domain